MSDTATDASVASTQQQQSTSTVTAPPKSAASSAGGGGGEAIRVIVRCRPFNELEKSMNSVRCVEMNLKRNEVTLRNMRPQQDLSGTAVIGGSSPAATLAQLSATAPVGNTIQEHTFTFDSVFDETSTQKEVYEKTARPIVEAALQGFNGTIFAYGQTGSGKTFTMEGAKEDSEEGRGLIPNSFEHIFGYIQDASNANKTFLVGCSMLEIYNDDIFDLLSKDPKQKLQISELPDKGFVIKGLRKYMSSTVKEMHKCLKVGNHKRTVGSTNMNERSSRSHAIFIITIEMSEDSPVDGKKHIKVGKLNMVDLAGSERVSKTGATGERATEGAHINLSLSALINVIQKLSTPKKGEFVPYRDSKLTMLLKDSLGGNTKTMMIANFSPAEYNYEETLSTLRYAMTAKKIKNKPKINEDPKDALLRKYQEQIEALRRQLTDQTGGDGGVGAGTAGGNIFSALPLRNLMEEETLRKMMENNEQEKQRLLKEMQERTEKEKEALEAERKRVEEERIRIEQELRKRQDDLERQRRQRLEAEQKLKEMESRVVQGGMDIGDVVKLQDEQITKHKNEIEKRQRIKEQTAKALEQHEQVLQEMEASTQHLYEEAEVKTKKLKKLWNKYQLVKEELENVQHEWNQEKFEYLDTIRECEREMRLLQAIIECFIPPMEVEKVMQRAMYDEDYQDWAVIPLMHQHDVPGRHMPRPPSARPQLRWTMTDYGRRAAEKSDNPRFKRENIVALDLEMPVRTTEDFATEEDHLQLQAAAAAAEQEELDYQMNEQYYMEQQAMAQYGRRASMYGMPSEDYYIDDGEDLDESNYYEEEYVADPRGTPVPYARPASALRQ